MKRAAEYYLMHKDIRVCLMDIDENGNIGSVRRNEAAAAHFPLGGQMNNMKFHEWWRDRAIPKTRHGAKMHCRNWVIRLQTVLWSIILP